MTPSDWSLLLMGVDIALIGLVLVLWIALRRLRASLAAQSSQTHSMGHDLRSLCSAAVTMGERVNRLEQQMRDILARQEELGVRQDRLDQSSGEGHSYDHAIKLARKGASVEDLVEVCGLARGEAELIAMMHRYGD